MSLYNKANDWLKNSVSLRVFIIVALFLLLLIPLFMIDDIIHERENRRNSAIEEVSSKWGEPQHIGAAVISVPFYNNAVSQEGSSEDKRHSKTISYLHFLPEELKIDGKIDPEIRYRGIFEFSVFSSDLNISGKFNFPDIEKHNISANNVIWDEITISLGISDLRGIKENIELNWDDQQYSFEPGLKTKDIFTQGVSTKIPIKYIDSLKKRSYDFDINLKLNGSESIQFFPLGKTTKVNLNSDWQNPSFSGAYLPNLREVSDEGFSADWNVYHLNRHFPQSFVDTSNDVKGSEFGVDLYIPADNYQKSSRATKYGFMIIALTFAIFFFVELLQKVRLHPIQYIMIGFAIVIFYSLLVSISEHLNFNLSYIISAISTIVLITLYTKSIFNNTKITLLFASALSLLYLFKFTLIQLVDYSILIGSIGLFTFLATVMYISRNIDWYSIQEMKDKKF